MLDQTGADDHVHYVHIVSHAAGDAGEDHAAHAVIVDQRLGAGGGQHLAHAGPHQHDVYPVERAGVEGVAGHGFLLGDLRLLHQLFQLYVHGADDAEGTRPGLALTCQRRRRSQGYR